MTTPDRIDRTLAYQRGINHTEEAVRHLKKAECPWDQKGKR